MDQCDAMRVASERVRVNAIRSAPDADSLRLTVRAHPGRCVGYCYRRQSEHSCQRCVERLAHEWLSRGRPRPDPRPHAHGLVACIAGRMRADALKLPT